MQKYGHLVLVLDYSKAQSAPRQERRRLRVLTRVRIPSAIYTRRRWRVVRTSAFCLLPFAFYFSLVPVDERLLSTEDFCDKAQRNDRQRDRNQVTENGQDRCKVPLVVVRSRIRELK